MSAPQLKAKHSAGYAEYTLDGRPYAELRIYGDLSALDHKTNTLIRMIDTAYEAGRADARYEMRKALGLQK